MFHPRTRLVDLQVTPVSELPAAQVRVDMGGSTYEFSDGYGLGPNRPLQQPIVISSPTGRDAEAMWLTVTSPARGKQYRYVIALPLNQRVGEPVTMLLQNRPVDEALRQLVPYLGRPVVAAGLTEGTVTLNVTGERATDCLDQIASQLGARVTPQTDGYHLTPAP